MGFIKGQTVQSKTTGRAYTVAADQRGGRVALVGLLGSVDVDLWKDASDLELVGAAEEEAFDPANVEVEVEVGEEPEGDVEVDIQAVDSSFKADTAEPHAGYFAKKFDQGKADANLLPGEPTACVIAMMLDEGIRIRSLCDAAQGPDNVVNSAEVMAGALLFQGVQERSVQKLAQAFVALDIANRNDGEGSLLVGVLKVLEFGAKKYAPNSWQSVPDAETRYANAAKRHWLFPANLRELDDDSKLQHRWHLATNLLFLIHFFGKAVSA